MTIATVITKEQAHLFKKMEYVCWAIDHKLRRSMLDLMLAKGEIKVTDMFVRLHIEQAVASQNLKILRDAKLVNTRRDGRNIYYSVNEKRISEYTEAVKSLFN